MLKWSDEKVMTFKEADILQYHLNSALILLGVCGVIQPTTSAFVHNTSTLAIVAYLSGCINFADTFFHVFMLFFAVNIYDMVVLDWGIFCHSKKLRIPGTEDMDEASRTIYFMPRAL